MSTVKQGLTGLNATSLVAYVQAIHDKLNGNVNFATPIPALATVQTAIDALIAANAAVDGNPGPVEHQARRVAEAKVKGYVRQWAGYVQAESTGDASVILSSGFELRRKASRIGSLKRPSDLAGKFIDVTGGAKLKWDPSYGADLYLVYMSLIDAPYNWELVGTTTKSSFTMTGLEPGKFYSFSVTAIGAAGETSKSEACRLMAAA
jgi:hypothetical protein